MQGKTDFHTPILLVLLAVCAFLAFYHLDQPAFWDDETGTCIFGRNIVNGYGYSGWDGRNLFGYHNGQALDRNLRLRDSPLGPYVAAASFKLFGISDFTGRLPFALCGMLSLVTLWSLLRHDFENAPEIALYGVAALGLSVTFLLTIRNARYYSLSILSSLLILLCYRRFLASKRATDILCLAAAAVAAFYSSFLLGVVLLLALAITHFVFHRNELTVADWRKVALATVLFLAATLPYAMRYQIWSRSDFPDPTPWPLRHLRILWWNFRDLNLLAILPWTAAAALAIVCFRASHDRQTKPENRTELARCTEWIAFVAAYIMVLSFVSPEQTYLSSLADFRYICPIYALLAGLMGVVLWYLHRRSRPAAIATLVTIVLCNVLTLSPFPQNVIAGPSGFQWLLPAFIGQITHPYPTATEEVADYLRDHAGQDDLVMTNPDYMEYPLLWYVGAKVKICCQLDDDSPLPQARIRALGAPVFMDDSFPDWLVFYAADPQDADLINLYSRPYKINGILGSRHYRMEKLLHVYYDQTQRPELVGHSFGPKTDFDSQHGVAIFHSDPWRPMQVRKRGSP